MSAHTRGPWEARDVSHDWMEILGPADELGSQFIIATVLPSQYVSLGRGGEQVANARLIAAAPELLEACKALWSGDIHPAEVKLPPALAERIMQAIAKAEGA